jgi:hypothetical protein
MPKTTTIIIRAYPIIEHGAGCITLEMGIGKDHPSKRVAIQTVTDCKTALRAFAAEVEATRKPWRLLVSFDKSSGRKPNGFEKARDAGELQQDVNLDLAPLRRTG